MKSSKNVNGKDGIFQGQAELIQARQAFKQ